MVRRKVYERGDIVKVSLNPVVGREQQGDFRPCLVLSLSPFNQLGAALVVPITQGFTVSLTGLGIKTEGVVLINGVRMLDLDARKAK